MKYVIGTTGFVLFPDHIVHADMAKACQPEIGSPVSAGFVRLVHNRYETFGRSHSLRLSAKRSDDEILNQ